MRRWDWFPNWFLKVVAGRGGAVVRRTSAFHGWPLRLPSVALILYLLVLGFSPNLEEAFALPDRYS